MCKKDNTSASNLLSNCLSPSLYLIETVSLKSIWENIHCVEQKSYRKSCMFTWTFQQRSEASLKSLVDFLIYSALILKQDA